MRMTPIHSLDEAPAQLNLAAQGLHFPARGLVAGDPGLICESLIVSAIRTRIQDT
ncbi:MAG: hypothetical protein H0T77_13450 [Pyrinomonadaceae bacterium]|nr:hypothetical protein [Pyrinomonadaceae bacterium]